MGTQDVVGPAIRELIDELKEVHETYSSKTTNEWLETALRASPAVLST
jgi:hypothetical protein